MREVQTAVQTNIQTTEGMEDCGDAMAKPILADSISVEEYQRQREMAAQQRARTAISAADAMAQQARDAEATPATTPHAPIIGTIGGADMVNHPPHYTAGGIECIDALEAATIGLKGIEAVCTANAIKYLWRWKQKGGKQDLEKAIWYIRHMADKQ